MQDEYIELAELVGHSSGSCISYSQLKRILKTLDYQYFNKQLATIFNVDIQHQNGQWYAIDGKELRGSIDTVSGEKRGENIVICTAHNERSNHIIDFYKGKKESEKTCVLEYFKRAEKLTSKYTLDAFHLYPELLETIHQKSGIYLIQVKANQHLLLEDCQHLHQYLPGKKHKTIEKGHGRIEIRESYCYDLQIDTLNERWCNTGISTLVVTERTVIQLKTNKVSKETSYWVANEKRTAENEKELIQAVRLHWSVEVENSIRDKQMGEDNLITRDANESNLLAVFITYNINILQQITNRNYSQLRQRLSKNKNYIIDVFNQLNFL
jgi:predicted transposase YbfD/YdcC